MQLLHGLANEILAPTVNSETKRVKYYKQSYHTARLVMTLLSAPQLLLPYGDYNFPFKSAKDMFVGYTMFDAWTGNQDRHSENWGIIASSRGLELTPTYDHASSLGRNENDEKRLIRLQTKDFGQSVDHYVTKARSALFKNAKDPKPLSTIEAFLECSRQSPDAADFWLDKLEKISDLDIQNVFLRIPTEFITTPAAQFAIKMLDLNKARLLETRK